MGSAMLRGWLNDTSLEAHFIIIEPSNFHLDWARKCQNVAIYSDCKEAIEAKVPISSIVVLAVKPQVMSEAISFLGSLIDNNTAFLTIAAGISTSWLKTRLGAEHQILRAMPNTPAAIGKGITALYPNNSELDLVNLSEKLLGAVGTVVIIEDEKFMDAITALSGSGPAYVFLLAEAMTNAGIAVGLPISLAKQLSEATIAGAGALIESADEPASVLRENVTSKGGTTAAALDVLMAENGFSFLMEQAVKAAKARSVALGA